MCIQMGHEQKQKLMFLVAKLVIIISFVKRSFLVNITFDKEHMKNEIKTKTNRNF